MGWIVYKVNVVLKLLNPIPTGFLNGRYLLGGGALLGPNNVRLSKVVKTPQIAPKLISIKYFGI